MLLEGQLKDFMFVLTCLRIDLSSYFRIIIIGLLLSSDYHYYYHLIIIIIGFLLLDY